MKSKRETSVIAPRPRGAILADIASIGPAVRGTLCEKPRRLADGSVRVYHQLQRWEGGRNRTRHVPEHLVEAFRDATRGGARLDALADELGACDTQAVLAGGGLKKKRMKSSRA